MESGGGKPMVIPLNRRDGSLARKVEFPELVEQNEIHLPDEISRRVGQSIAAASLPQINGED
jgi:hypothetical protein